MTQDELDALMDGDMDDIEGLEEVVSEDSSEMSIENDSEIPSELSSENNKKDSDEPYGYSEENAHHWPLPATPENKMVHQLDDVTKESEEKASEIFDIIEDISNQLMEKEANVETNIKVLGENVELFTTLTQKFPDVEAFKSSLQTNTDALNGTKETLEMLQSSGDSIMNVMDIMQYQDIHRQKIERVINVMRALSKYMNTLFEGRIDDDKRVSSAQHIAGDTHNDVASTDDIEALLAQFGQ